MVLYNLMCTQPAGGTTRHGGGIYGEVVFKRIVERKLPICAYYDSTKWLNPEIRNLIDNNRILLFDVSKTSLENIVQKNSISLIYTPLFGRNYASFNSCKVIGTLHGLRDLEMPNDKIVTRYKPFFKNWIKYHLRNVLSWKSHANRYRFVDEISKNKNIDFVVVSNHTANSYRVNYPQYADKNVSVFYSPSTIKDVVNYDFKKTSSNYFLIVSGNRWEKNALRAMIALDELASEQLIPADFKVVITGASSEELYRYKFKKNELFEYKGYVSDNELADLYHNAYCFIYPTLNEGFGYPPLEAMYHHVPVITSAICSIPEICGDAVLYFSPFSINEIKCRILQILSEDVHKELSEKGYKRCCDIKKKQDEDLDKLIDYIFVDIKK